MPVLLVINTLLILSGVSAFWLGRRCLKWALVSLMRLQLSPRSIDKGTISGKALTNSSMSIKCALFGCVSIKDLLNFELERPTKRVTSPGLNEKASRESNIRNGLSAFCIWSRPVMSRKTNLSLRAEASGRNCVDLRRKCSQLRINRLAMICDYIVIQNTQQELRVQKYGSLTRVVQYLIIQMKLQSFLAIVILAGALTVIYHKHNNVLSSQIVPNQQDFSFYFADSYKFSWSKLVFRFDPNSKPYDAQLKQMESNCRGQNGLKLVLVKSKQGHIFGGFNVDLCFTGKKPQYELTPFIFSINTTERMLFMVDSKIKVEKGPTEGFLFGRTAYFRQKADASGIEFCFHGGLELGRVMSWLNTPKGKCAQISNIEIYNVALKQVFDIKSKFEDFMDSEELVDINDS